MKDNKIPSPLVSLLPVFVLILLLFVTIRTFGSDALSGGSQVCLLVATAVCVLIGMAGFRRPWKDFELAVTNNIAGVSTALIILLIIGALSGAWMVSGVVPTLIYYGIQVIHPHFFLVSTCIICAVVLGHAYLASCIQQPVSTFFQGGVGNPDGRYTRRRHLEPGHFRDPGNRFGIIKIRLE